jgi:hypothetical protein
MPLSHALRQDALTLEGSLNQLQTLCDAVRTYVERWLSVDLLQEDEARNFPPPKSSETSINSELALANLPPGLSQLRAPAEPIYLLPSGCLSHELFLGDLATEGSGKVVNLSATQLFDLLVTLEAYAAEAPEFKASQRTPWFRSPQLKVAAIAVLSVGLTTLMAQGIYQTTISKTSNLAPLSSADSLASKSLPPNPQSSASPLVIPPFQTQLPPASKNKPSIPKSASQPAPSTPQPAPALVPLPPPASRQTQQLQPLPKSKTTAVPDVILAPASQPPTASTLAKPTAPSRESTDLLPELQPQLAQPQVGQSQLEQPQAGQPQGSQFDNSSPIPSASDLPPLTPPSQPKAPSSIAKSQDAAPTGTVFDTIQQVAQVRLYFQQHWTPPEGLSQVLEYHLILNPNGSLQQISPLGQAAGQFLDRTNMPLLGESFVSPVESGKTAKIRLVLSPDGKVQTFLESLN